MTALDVSSGAGKVVWAELVVDPGLAPPVGPPPVDAVLVDVPIRLFLTDEVHLETLRRELLLRAADWSARHDHLVKGLARSLVRHTSTRSVTLADARREADAGHAVLTMRVPTSPAVSSGQAQELVDLVALSESVTEGRARCDEGMAADELRHFRRWYAAELAHQARGGAPRPCPFRP